MKTSSCKAKGRKLQDYVAEKLFWTYREAEQGDFKPAIMGETGEDIKMSPLAKTLCPFDIECKNQERLNLWGSIEQTESNTAEGRIPLLIFKRNRSKVYACIELDYLLEMM